MTGSARLERLGSPSSFLYVNSPHPTISNEGICSWLVEIPNLLIEAIPYEERVGNVVNRFLQIVQPKKYSGAFLDATDWMNCTKFLQKARGLSPDPIQIGKKLSNHAYMKLIELAYPNFPQPSDPSFIKHLASWNFIEPII